VSDDGLSFTQRAEAALPLDSVNRPYADRHIALRGCDPLGTLDANRNHMVEEAEAQAAGRQLFDTLDKDRDGAFRPMN